MSLKKIVGNNIRTIRLQKKMSQSEAAKLVGVSGSYWGYLERGERNPGLELIEEIAKVFDISLHVLLFGSDYKIPSVLYHRIYNLVSLGDNHIQFLVKVIDAYIETIENN